MKPALPPPGYAAAALAAAVLSLLGMASSAAAPAWWSDPATSIAGDTPVNDWAAANLGQLKHVATQAKAHLDFTLASIGGAGPEIDAMCQFTQQDNYAPAAVGQLKNVAKVFYDRLAQAQWNWQTGYPGTASTPYPWTGTAHVENAAPINIGQLKNVFSFDLSSWASFEQDADSMADGWEVYYGLNPGNSADADQDWDNDGLTNREEYAANANPLTADTDGDFSPDAEEVEEGTDPRRDTSAPIRLCYLAHTVTWDANTLPPQYTPEWFEEFGAFDSRGYFQRDGARSGHIYTQPEPLSGQANSLELSNLTLNEWSRPAEPCVFPVLPVLTSAAGYRADTEGSATTVGGVFWLRGPKSAAPVTRSYVKIIRSNLPAEPPSDTYSTVSFTIPAGQFHSLRQEMMVPLSGAIPAASYSESSSLYLLPVEVTEATGPEAGKLKEVIPQWSPDNGIGKGPRTPGLPYGTVSLNLSSSPPVLSCFGQSYTLQASGSSSWINSAGTVSVELETPRAASPTEKEIIRTTVKAPVWNMSAATYTMVETSASSSSFTAHPPPIALDISVLSTSQADQITLDITENFSYSVYPLLETGEATRQFAGAGRHLSFLNTPAPGGSLLIRLATVEFPEQGPVYELRLQDGSWKAYYPDTRTNAPAASAPHKAKWHLTLKGLGSFGGADIPVEFVEQYRELPSTVWSTAVVGSGHLTVDGTSCRTLKPVIMTSPGSNLDDVPAADKDTCYVLVGHPCTPSAKGKRVVSRYGIRFTDNSLLPQGTMVAAKPKLRPAMVMRSLDSSEESGQGLDEEDDIIEPLEKLGYNVYEDLDTEASEIDGNENSYLRWKDVVYLMAHGGLTGQTGPVHFFTPSYDPTADFGGVAFQKKASFKLLASWISLDEYIQPSLTMMAGCATGLTTRDRSSVPREDGFLPGSAEFANSFAGAYVGYAWHQSPKEIFTLMKAFTKELRTTRTYRESYVEYLNSNPSMNFKFLKLYRFDDESFSPNDQKPATVPEDVN